MLTVQDFHSSPNVLAEHYRHFRVADRLLLTGHSHQAWPDTAFRGLEQSWQDATHYVDDKWQRAFEVANEVKEGFSALMHDKSGYYTLGQSTHELLVRFLSGLDLKKRPRLITTDGEFHSMRRQLDRLTEEGVEVVRVPSQPVSTVGERLSDEVNDKTAAVLVSSVFYDSGLICPGLSDLLAACRQKEAELLVDVYHHLNIVPFDISALGLQEAYLVGGGYKYCQLGEGNCFLRFPQACQHRPVVTGWFAEFDVLSEALTKEVGYPQGGGRYAGATYDPVSHYRAAEVFGFFRRYGLNVELLRQVSQHQLALLIERFDVMALPANLIDYQRDVELNQRGGFLVLTSPLANDISKRLRERGVFTDVRGQHLRLGPAPYLSDNQLHEAMDIFEAVSKF